MTHAGISVCTAACIEAGMDTYTHAHTRRMHTRVHTHTPVQVACLVGSEPADKGERDAGGEVVIGVPGARAIGGLP